jgi:hypothetical protein
MILARVRREPAMAAAGSVSFFDIKAGLKQMEGDIKQSFPTFTRILSHTTLH